MYTKLVGGSDFTTLNGVGAGSLLSEISTALQATGYDWTEEVLANVGVNDTLIMSSTGSSAYNFPMIVRFRIHEAFDANYITVQASDTGWATSAQINGDFDTFTGIAGDAIDVTIDGTTDINIDISAATSIADVVTAINAVTALGTEASVDANGYLQILSATTGTSSDVTIADDTGTSSGAIDRLFSPAGPSRTDTGLDGDDTRFSAGNVSEEIPLFMKETPEASMTYANTFLYVIGDENGFSITFSNREDGIGNTVNYGRLTTPSGDPVDASNSTAADVTGIVISTTSYQRPVPATVVAGATIDDAGTYTNTCIDSAATFVTNGVVQGDTVYNLTNNSVATVLEVVDETTLITTPLVLPGGGPGYFNDTDSVGVYRYATPVQDGIVYVYQDASGRYWQKYFVHTGPVHEQHKFGGGPGAKYNTWGQSNVRPFLQNLFAKDVYWRDKVNVISLFHPKEGFRGYLPHVFTTNESLHEPKFVGTNDNTSSATQLNCASATFIADGVIVGDKVTNRTEGKVVTVTAVNSETQLVTTAVEDWDEDEFTVHGHTGEANIFLTPKHLISSGTATGTDADTIGDTSFYAVITGDNTTFTGVGGDKIDVHIDGTDYNNIDVSAAADIADVVTAINTATGGSEAGVDGDGNLTITSGVAAAATGIVTIGDDGAASGAVDRLFTTAIRSAVSRDGFTAQGIAVNDVVRRKEGNDFSRITAVSSNVSMEVEALPNSRTWADGDEYEIYRGVAFDIVEAGFVDSPKRASTTLPIDSVVNGASGTFTVLGDHTDSVRIGDTFDVVGSTGNDDSYTVTDVTLPVADTVIEVANIASAVADGTINMTSGPYYWDVGVNNLSPYERRTHNKVRRAKILVLE